MEITKKKGDMLLSGKFCCVRRMFVVLENVGTFIICIKDNPGSESIKKKTADGDDAFS